MQINDIFTDLHGNQYEIMDFHVLGPDYPLFQDNRDAILTSSTQDEHINLIIRGNDQLIIYNEHHKVYWMYDIKFIQHFDKFDIRKGFIMKRIPRVTGLTAMMVEYHQTVSPEIKDVKKKNIITHVVNQWALNNGLLCGVIHNPSSLASYLGCDIEDINMVLRERLLNNRIWDKQNQEEILNAIQVCLSVWQWKIEWKLLLK